MYNLEDLTPRPVDFTLSHGEHSLELTFRPFVLADESWLNREFGKSELERIFTEFDMAKICKIGFHQLTLESKRKLMDVKFIDLDEFGEEFEVAKNGVEKILMLLSSIKDQVNFVKFLIETRGASFPVLKEIGEKLEEEVKKKKESLQSVKS